MKAEDAPESALTDGVASESIADETRTFRFTGEFTAFSVDGKARVRVDGEPFDVDAFPHNTLEISPNGTVEYDVSASGAVSVDKDTIDRPNARTATGRARETHVVSYAGELTYFELDGDATIRRNGSRIDSSDVLPSTRPHEFKATARSSREAYTVETTRNVDESVAPHGTSGAARFTGRTVRRYAGQVTAVEHPNGVRVEIDDDRNQIVARAPGDAGARVSVETTNGLVVDHEAYDVADLSVSAGESVTAVPFGDLERIVIDDLSVQLSRNEYPSAEKSTTLQAAAKVERTDAFQRLVDIASGRVRYDAAGIAGQEVRSGDTTTVRSVEHELADPGQGDSAVLSVRQTPRGIEHASVLYKHFERNEQVTIDAVILPVGPTVDKLRRESETMTVSRSESEPATPDVEYTAELFAETANPDKQVKPSDLGDLEARLTPEDVRTQGFLSFLNDVKDLLTDIGADAYDAAKRLWGVFKGHMDQVAVTAQNIVISSPYLIAGLADDLPWKEQWAPKLIWRIAMAPAVTLVSLASNGFFEALDTGAGCAFCVFFAVVLRDIIVSEVTSAACVYFIAALPAAVVCAVVAEALTQFISQYFGYRDVKDDLCNGDVISEIDPC
ncbi:hypothetical protein [Halorubellus litoreus]|uniref:Uncharacterized protein n=1 Tax=Halorubellus litoreus TaxID=755308 RepID=A0ABD5V9L2_9EURY